MKTSSHSSFSKGFTLIELLVVIAIIAVLASAGFAVGPGLINRAKKMSGQATAISLATAVEQFYTEYSALPDSGSNNADAQFTTNTSPLLEILAGTTSAQNPRGIRFLSVKEARNNLDGAVYAGNTISAIYDPWGQPYYIRLDYNYDESLTLNPGNTGSVNLKGRRVAVYSLGVKPPAAATAQTLIKTW